MVERCRFWFRSIPFFFLVVIFLFSVSLFPALFCSFSPSVCWAQADSSEEPTEMLSCDTALKKLNNAVEQCIDDDMDEVNNFFDETGVSCLEDVLSDKNEEFFNKCFNLKENIENCQIKEISDAEEFIEKNKERLLNYRVIREKILRAKCNDFYSTCVKSKILDAYDKQDIQTIIEIEKQYNYSFESFKNCSNFKEIRMIVLDKKSEYYKNYLEKSIDGSLQTGDVGTLMSSRDAVSEYFENCRDFSDMTGKMQKTMCTFYVQWYDKLHEKIIESCDFDLLDLVDKFGAAEELANCGKVDFQMEDVVMSLHKDRVDNTKCLILLKCGSERIKAIANQCNPKHLKQLYKVINSCEGSELEKQAIKKQVCLPLTECFINDLSAAAYNCNYHRLKMISNSLTLLDSYACGTKNKVQGSLSAAKKEYQKCFERNLKVGKTLCDFERVVDIQHSLRLPFWGGQFDEFNAEIVKAKKEMGGRCLGAVLKKLLYSCDYSTLEKLLTYVREGLLSYPPREEMNKLIDEAKLKFSQNCLGEEIEVAFESCNVEALLKWEKILKNEFKQLPQSAILLETIQKQKNMFFDHCYRDSIAEAQQNFDVFLIQDIEEDVEKYLKNLPGIKGYRDIIREAKDYCLRGGM